MAPVSPSGATYSGRLAGQDYFQDQRYGFNPRGCWWRSRHPPGGKDRGVEAGPGVTRHSPLYGAAHDDDSRDGVLLNRPDAQHGGRALYRIPRPGSTALLAHVEPAAAVLYSQSP